MLPTATFFYQVHTWEVERSFRFPSTAFAFLGIMPTLTRKQSEQRPEEIYQPFFFLRHKKNQNIIQEKRGARKPKIPLMKTELRHHNHYLKTP